MVKMADRMASQPKRAEGDDRHFIAITADYRELQTGKSRNTCAATK